MRRLIICANCAVLIDLEELGMHPYLYPACLWIPLPRPGHGIMLDGGVEKRRD